MKYWINTISSDVVHKWIKGEFTQAKYGKRERLDKLELDDYILFYSPRTEYQGGYPVQAFTAIGIIAGEKPYQVEVKPDYHPWRLRVDFLDCHTTPILPLIENLDFIEDKVHWGPSLYHGLFDINKGDFKTIVRAMGIELKITS